MHVLAADWEDCPALIRFRGLSQPVVLAGIPVTPAENRRNVCGCVIVKFFSTCATYGEPDQVPISEECRRWPTKPYNWSKLCMERVLDSYGRAYRTKFVALRYFNAAGANKRMQFEYS
jgi:nucleoside-diphosphate-sugar epimerase